MMKCDGRNLLADSKMNKSGNIDHHTQVLPHISYHIRTQRLIDGKIINQYKKTHMDIIGLIVVFALFLTGE